MCFINPPSQGSAKKHCAHSCASLYTRLNLLSRHQPFSSRRLSAIFAAFSRRRSGAFHNQERAGDVIQMKDNAEKKKEKKGRKNKHVCTPGSAFSQQSLTLRLCLPKGNIHTYFHTWVQTEAKKVDERGVALHYYRWRYVIKTQYENWAGWGGRGVCSESVDFQIS